MQPWNTFLCGKRQYIIATPPPPLSRVSCKVMYCVTYSRRYESQMPTIIAPKLFTIVFEDWCSTHFGTVLRNERVRCTDLHKTMLQHDNFDVTKLRSGNATLVVNTQLLKKSSSGLWAYGALEWNDLVIGMNHSLSSLQTWRTGTTNAAL